jgi:uncharacterized membrane protein
MSIKSDFEKNLEEYKRNELKALIEDLKKDAQKNGDKDFDPKSREEYEINQRLLARTTAERYENKDEIRKEHRIWRVILLSLLLLINTFFVVNIIHSYSIYSYRLNDVDKSILGAIVVVADTIISYFVGYGLLYLQHEKEHSFDLDVEAHKKSEENNHSVK